MPLVAVILISKHRRAAEHNSMVLDVGGLLQLHFEVAVLTTTTYLAVFQGNPVQSRGVSAEIN